MDKYVIDINGNPRPATNSLEWALWFDGADRQVADTRLGDVRVSTVFLGFDHNVFGGRPLLYETMIFGGDHDQYQERYATRDEAPEGHKKAEALVNG